MKFMTMLSVLALVAALNTKVASAQDDEMFDEGAPTAEDQMGDDLSDLKSAGGEEMIAPVADEPVAAPPAPAVKPVAPNPKKAEMKEKRQVKKAAKKNKKMAKRKAKKEKKKDKKTNS